MLMTNIFLSPRLVAGFSGLLLVLLTVGANAGSLDAPAAPSVAASAMFTITDLYNRLNTGATGAKRAGAFVEPASAPASTVYTLDQIMGLMPTVDDTNGATVGDVLSGKTFWNLRSGVGVWGSRTGTMPIQTLNAASTTVNAGYYAATTLNAVDADLAAGNIKSGINIFGVSGTYPLSAVPRTGQTTAYDTGDDGALLKGVALPSPRFKKNVNAVNDTGIGGGIAGNGICDGTETCNGTVTDNLTGLIWLTNANCFGSQTWATALSSANTLADGACGLTDGSVAGDWRLPNRHELFSLNNDQYTDPPLSNTAGTAKWTPGNPFTGVQSLNYWSSTTSAANTTTAWGLNFFGGSMNQNGKLSSYPVWPVRGGL